MEAFGRSSFGFTVKGTCLLAAVLSIALPVLGRVNDVPGLWIGVLWLGVKAWLMHRLMLAVSQPKPEEKKKLFAVAFVKFPVLYLAGFFLLLTDWVTLEGVFYAFTSFFAATAAGMILRRRDKSKAR